MERALSEDVLMQSRVVPANFGPLRGANGNARITGPCGDTMEFWLAIHDDRIAFATYTTDGCEHSVLCGSIAATLAAGMTLQRGTVLSQQDVLAVAKDVTEETAHCALLAANTVRAAINGYLDEQQKAAAACDNPEGDCGSCGKGDCDVRSASPVQQADGAGSTLNGCLDKIRKKIVVISGKGGVGKSTVAVNMAMALSLQGKRVGLLDVDLHGPSVPTMLGLTDVQIFTDGDAIIPARVGTLSVMSLGFMLSDRDEAVIWRGPMKTSVIGQLLKDVAWGELDYLIVDCPPGTGDEPLSVCQLLEHPDGAVVVTTPQEVAVADVRKSVNFCRQLDIPVLGVVENMSGFACPECGTVTAIFKTGGGKQLADAFHVPFLGCIPIDPAIGVSGDNGAPFVRQFSDSAAARAFAAIVGPILQLTEHADFEEQPSELLNGKREEVMRVAVPVADGKLNLHFGHCETLALLDVNQENNAIVSRLDVTPPPHEPGLLPRWLAEKNVNVVIAGGMGQRAQSLFAENDIEVVTGAPAETPEALVLSFLNGTLLTGANACDH